MLLKRVKEIEGCKKYIPTDFDTRFKISKEDDEMYIFNITFEEFLDGEDEDTISFGKFKFEDNKIKINYETYPFDDKNCLSSLIDFLSLFGAKSYSGRIVRRRWIREDEDEFVVIKIKNGSPFFEEI